MFDLLSRVVLAGSRAEMRPLLDAIVNENADGVLRLTLRAPVSIPGLGVQIALVHDVMATIAKSSAAESYDVCWRPADDGPFPRFAGALTLIEHERTQLALSGSYELADDRILVRDALLAHRIAQATAGAMLAGIAGALERRQRDLDSDRLSESDEEPA